MRREGRRSRGQGVDIEWRKKGEVWRTKNREKTAQEWAQREERKKKKVGGNA